MKTQTRTIDDIARAIRRKLCCDSDEAYLDWRVEVIPTQGGQWTWRLVGSAEAPAVRLRAAPAIGLLQRKFRLRH